ncbi:hypothetical protein BGX24_007386 [Mortierella sp. AD032]|nr:hypothetical protein BGX24_007386 [Mortierella sp. AD032]
MKAITITLLAVIATLSSSSLTTHTQAMSYGCPFGTRQCIAHCKKVGYKSGICGQQWDSLNCYCSMTANSDYSNENAAEFVLAPDTAANADACAKVVVDRPLL